SVKFVLPSVDCSLDVDAHVPVGARGDFSDVDLWTGRTCRLGRSLSSRNRARLRRGTGIWRCRRLCALGGSTGHAQQQNGHQSARNISKSVDHRLPPRRVIPSSRRLTVDGVDNKANGRFCRLAGMGIAQPWWYSLPQSGVPSGAIRVRMPGRIDVHTAPFALLRYRERTAEIGPFARVRACVRRSRPEEAPVRAHYLRRRVRGTRRERWSRSSRGPATWPRFEGPGNFKNSSTFGGRLKDVVS